MKTRTAVLLTIALVLVVAFGLLFLVALTLGLGLFGGSSGGSVPGAVILEADLDTGIIEYVPDDPVAQWMLEDAPTTRDLVDALNRAAGDERVVGLIARVGTGGMGLAQCQEIRDAVRAFRESGKPAIAYAETFGEVAQGTGAYYLATAFDEIHLQPSGDVGLTGLLMEAQFLRGTLDKLGVEPRMDHRKEYKNAMNAYTETSFTEAHRESMTAVLESVFGEIVAGIAEARGKGEDEVENLIDQGPFLGQEAVDAGLVDRLSYRDEAYARIRELAGGEEAELLYLTTYLARAGRPNGRGETVALVYGVGAVVRGPSGFDPLTGAMVMGSDSVAAALRAAVEDEDVRAILFRVDSPGGSYVASDAIWRETVRAREAGKPVVVSMGNLAGSGGYFVAMAADKIVAQPGTITASIGVLGGKLLTREMWAKLGISFDEIETSANASMWTFLQDYDEAEWERFQAWLDRVYGDFTAKVADGRGMPLERVQEIAKGRVWSGRDALELGLVDELGGMATALELARAAAGLEPDAPVRLELYPRHRSTWEHLFGDEPASSQDRAAAAAVARVFERLRPLGRLAQRLGLAGPGAQPLSMPPELALGPPPPATP